MKILRVLTRPNLGGPMRQAIALWHAFAKLGHCTVLAVGRCEDDEPALDPSAFGIGKLESLDAVRSAEPGGGWIEVPQLKRGIAPLADARSQVRLRAVIAAFQPDVVHSHMTKAGALARRAARGRVPCVAHTFHGLVLRDYAGPIASRALRWLERSLARHTDLLFAVSDSCRDELASLGVADRVRVVPTAIEFDALRRWSRAEARTALGLPRNATIFGFLGRLVPIKRPEWFAHLLERRRDLIGIMVGDGPLRASVERSRAATEGRLHLRTSSDDPGLVLAAIDALVLPSRREGHPLVGVEAATFGVPTLGFRVPGLVDLAESTGDTWLADAESGLDGLVEATARYVAAGCPRSNADVAALRARHDPLAVARLLAEAYLSTFSAKIGVSSKR
ncbi:MAG: glycosyltransferase [Planctomycetota bacterium]